MEAAGDRSYDCGEFYDQNGKYPGYLGQESVIGSEQHVQVVLVRGYPGGRATDSHSD